MPQMFPSKWLNIFLFVLITIFMMFLVMFMWHKLWYKKKSMNKVKKELMFNKKW